jgi:hypothetical protein
MSAVRSRVMTGACERLLSHWAIFAEPEICVVQVSISNILRRLACASRLEGRPPEGKS